MHFLVYEMTENVCSLTKSVYFVIMKNDEKLSEPTMFWSIGRNASRNTLEFAVKVSTPVAVLAVLKYF